MCEKFLFFTSFQNVDTYLNLLRYLNCCGVYANFAKFDWLSPHVSISYCFVTLVTKLLILRFQSCLVTRETRLTTPCFR